MKIMQRAVGFFVAMGLAVGVSVASPSATAEANVLTGFATPLHSQTFRDVPPSADFYSDIEWLYTSGVTTGWDDGTYRPHDSINRDAFAAFVYRMAGEPRWTAPSKSPFKDVATNHPFYNEITWLATQGITKGWSDGTFRPSQPIGRDAIAAFLYRFACEPTYTPTKSFKDTKGSEHLRAINWMASTGVSTGWADGTFRPQANTERAAMAAFLHRFHNLSTIGFKPYCEKPNTAGVQNILIMGSDSGSTRSNVKDGADNADAILVMQISADRQHISIMSIPRSTVAVMPASEKTGRKGLKMPVNMAFQSGPEVEAQAVANLLGVNINHWIVTDLQKFQSLVNEANGVKVNGVRDTCVKWNESAKRCDGVLLKGGVETLANGSQALSFTRERKNLPNGDDDRVRRHQQVMYQLHAKIFNKNALADPSTLAQLYNIYHKYTTHDDGFTLGYAVELASSVKSVGSRDIAFYTFPTQGDCSGKSSTDPVNVYTSNFQYCVEAHDTRKAGALKRFWQKGMAYQYGTDAQVTTLFGAGAKAVQ